MGLDICKADDTEHGDEILVATRTFCETKTYLTYENDRNTPEARLSLGASILYSLYMVRSFARSLARSFVRNCHN